MTTEIIDCDNVTSLIVKYLSDDKFESDSKEAVENFNKISLYLEGYKIRSDSDGILEVTSKSISSNFRDEVEKQGCIAATCLGHVYAKYQEKLEGQLFYFASDYISPDVYAATAHATSATKEDYSKKLVDMLNAELDVSPGYCTDVTDFLMYDYPYVDEQINHNKDSHGWGLSAPKPDNTTLTSKIERRFGQMYAPFEFNALLPVFWKVMEMNTRNGSSDSYNGAFIAAICQSFPDKIGCLAQDQKVLFITNIFKALPNIELGCDNEATLKLSEFHEDEGQAEFSTTHEVLLHYLNKWGPSLYTADKFKSMVAAGQAMNTLHLDDYWKHGIINEQTINQSLQGINL